MAESDKIVIDLDVDDTQANQSIDDFNDKAESKGKEAGKNFEKGFEVKRVKAFSQNLKDVNKKLDNLKNKLSDVSTSSKKASENIKNGFEKASQSTDNLKEAQKSATDATDKSIITFSTFLEIVQSARDFIDLLSFALNATGQSLEDILKPLEKFGINAASLAENIKNFRDILNKLRLEPTEENLRKLALSAADLLNTLGVTDGQIAKLIEKFDGLAGFGFRVVQVLDPLKRVFGDLIPVIPLATAALAKFTKTGKELVQITSGIGSVIRGGTKNIFGFTTALATAGSGLISLGNAIESSDSALDKFAGRLTELTGLLLTGFSAAISFAIIKIGEFSKSLGDDLVGAAQKTVEQFSKTQESIQVFEATIRNVNRRINGSIGTIEEWNDQIKNLSSEFNVTRNSLRKAGREIALVGERIGLNREQLQKLLRVTTEFAVINNKELFPTAVKLVRALQGNSQAVQSLGLKLSEASTQSFALKRGLASNVNQLSESEQAQIRFNQLLSQYNEVVGIAEKKTNTFASQQDKLNVNIERASSLLGAGASAIENLNLVSLALNKALDNVSDTIFKVTGFLGALTGRVLQVAGVLLKWSFIIFTVVESLRILNVILASPLTQTAFAKTIPLVNRSVNQLIVSLTGLNVQLRSTRDLARISTSAISNSINRLSLALTGFNKNALTFRRAITGSFSKVARLFKSISPVIIGFLASIAPFLIKLTAIAVAFKVLVDAFRKIEDRTQAFSRLADAAGSALDRFKTAIFNVNIDVEGLRASIFDLADRGFGLLTTAIAGTTAGFLELTRSNPFGIFDDSEVDKIRNAKNTLFDLTTTLASAGFSFEGLGKKAQSSTDKVNESIDKVNLRKLEQLRKKLENVGLSDLEKFKRNQQQRLDLLRRALKQQVITEQQFGKLREKVNIKFEKRAQERLANIGLSEQQRIRRQEQEKLNILKRARRLDLINQSEFERRKARVQERFEQKRKEAAKETAETSSRLANIVEKSAENAVVRLSKSLGEALAQGNNAFKAFASTALKILGDFAIRLGRFVITSSQAIKSLRDSLSNFTGFGAALATGAALIAVGAALKSFAGGPDSGSGGGGGGRVGGGPVDDGTGAPPFQNEEPGDEDRQTQKPQQINVTVEGNVLDRRETGLEIVEILQENFDQQNAEVVKA